MVYCLEILKGKEKIVAFRDMQIILSNFMEDKKFNPFEIQLFDRVLKNDISAYHEENIHSSGYVLDSLQASFWCFLNSNSYEEAVLKAVNLGEDTDTTGAITGGLAGIYYRMENIPSKWVQSLVRTSDIKDLAERLSKKLML